MIHHLPMEYHCHECGKETLWDVEHVFVDYHGLEHAMKCRECGKTVPIFAFARYQETGKIVIPV